MRETVLAPHHRATFDRARERVPAFAAHSSIVSVLAVLSDTSDERYAERDALTLALVCEQQREPSTLWTSALLIAYAPMLLRLRGGLVGNEVAADDLDMLVVEAFLEAVGRLHEPHRPGRTAIRLRRDVRRAVFRALNDERGRLDSAEPFDDELELDGLGAFATTKGGHEVDEDDREEMRRILFERAALHVSRERLELVAETYLRSEPLNAYVARTRSELDGAARLAEYERLKRDRLRTLKKLRVVFRGIDDDAGVRHVGCRLSAPASAG
jgi:hypothetical protein